MEIPRGLYNLAQKNKGIVDRLCLHLQCTSNDLHRDWQLSEEAGRIFMKDSFSIHKKNNLLSDQKMEIAKDLLSKAYALILIKPDMYHIFQSVINFLSNQGFCVVKAFDQKMSAHMYWNMHENSIFDPLVTDTIPSRAIIDTYSPVKVILLRFNKSHVKLESLFADNFYNTYKGEKGVKDFCTLHGKLGFSEATKLGFHTLNNPVIKMACDPLGAYQHIIEGKSGQQNRLHLHLEEKYQLLQYTGAGIYVPRGSQFINTACSLLKLEQLRKIQTK